MLLNEFVEFLFGYEIPKEEKENIKLALYSEYQTEKNVKISLSRTSVTSCRLFINWIIEKFANDYQFVPTNIQLQDEFSSSYSYACIVSNQCSICGEKATPVKFKGGYASLCDKHKEVSKKELMNEYHLPIIAVSENTVELLRR